MKPILIDRSSGARSVYVFWRNDKGEIWKGGHAPVSRRQILNVYERGLETNHLRWRFYKLEPVNVAVAARDDRRTPLPEKRWRIVSAKEPAHPRGHAAELLAILVKIQPATVTEILARAVREELLETRGANRRGLIRWYLRSLEKRGIVYVVDEQRKLPRGEERDAE